MYRSGKGVHRDYQSAVFWQERLARIQQGILAMGRDSVAALDRGDENIVPSPAVAPGPAAGGKGEDLGQGQGQQPPNGLVGGCGLDGAFLKAVGHRDLSS